MVEQSFLNAYNLLLGKTSYEELSKQEEFYLPQEHEDPKIILKHFEDIEDYEKCIEIRDSI